MVVRNKVVYKLHSNYEGIISSLNQQLRLIQPLIYYYCWTKFQSNQDMHVNANFFEIRNKKQINKYESVSN